MNEKLTDLQQAIKDIVDSNPGWDDDQVAKAAFSKLNPGMEWPKKNPTATYVQKMRRRFAKQTQPTNVEVQMPPEFFEPEETEDDEEPFDPIKAMRELGEEIETEETPTTAPAYDTSVEFSDDDMNAIIGLPFSKLARYTGYDGWRLDPRDPDDAKFIQLSNKMAHKYVPDLLTKYGLEIMWSISLMGFVGERMAGHKKYKADHATVIQQQIAKDAKKEAPAEATPSETTPAEAPETQQPRPGELAAGQDEYLRRQKGQ